VARERKMAIDDPYQKVLDDFLKKREEQLAQVTNTERAINLLNQTMGQEPMFPNAGGELARPQLGVRKDQFYGKPLATAVTEILKPRGHAVEPEKILEELKAGGFDFRVTGWKNEKQWLRGLSISLAKNPKFHRLPSGAFGLAEFYPNVMSKKAKAKAQDEEDVDLVAAAEEAIASGHQFRTIKE
jgi:hypothetical protein